jgi:cobalt-zinc-cadmium efflux system protein
MKTERNILIAFILNLLFAVVEFLGGAFTGSVAIMSDALHDAGDAFSIGVSYYFEKKSKKRPDGRYTYGYARYSVIGGLITTVVLLIGSVIMICNALMRMLDPEPIRYNGMMILALIGLLVNLCAAFFTREGGSLNQRAVNLHMLEDVLGWLVVLIGAVIMRFTDALLLDPIMSVGVSVFIFINAVKNMSEALHLLLEKAPENIDVNEIIEHLTEIDGVLDVHHVHVWSLDGQTNYATLHVVFDGDPLRVKEAVRGELRDHGIAHVTIELEEKTENCRDTECRGEAAAGSMHHHHHHHN